MLDQAQRLRQLAMEEINKSDLSVESTKPRIITVTSGKGGVGKSNFVVNLAVTLQKLDKRVLIFDADMGLGNDDVLMGFLPKHNVYDIIFNDKNIEEVLVEGPYGLKLLPGGTGITKIEDITKQQRESFISKLSAIEDVDYIIIDTGAGINRDVLGFVACCEELIILTTPEPTSLTDAYSLIKAVDYFKLQASARLVVNKVIDEEDALNTYRKFNVAVTKFLSIKLEYLGKMAEDRKLLDAVRKQQPFVMLYPNSEVARDVKYIADKIMGAKSNDNTLGIQGLFRKIFDIFS